MLLSISPSLQLPGIFGPATGVCGSETLSYGSSGSNATLQTFVAPANACSPATSDGYAYALSHEGLASYLLPDPGAALYLLVLDVTSTEDTLVHHQVQ